MLTWVTQNLSLMQSKVTNRLSGGEESIPALAQVVVLLPIFLPSQTPGHNQDEWSQVIKTGPSWDRVKAPMPLFLDEWRGVLENPSPVSVCTGGS
jgi:hypothetical protein